MHNFPTSFFHLFLISQRVNILSRNEIDSDFNINLRKIKRINYFWIGFIIYSTSYVIKSVTINPTNVYSVFQLIGLSLLIYSAIDLIEFKISNNYLKVVFAFLCIWQLFIIIRGGELNSIFIKSMIFEAYTGILLYLVPLIILAPKKLDILKKTFDTIIILSIIFILLDILYIPTLFASLEDTLLQSKIEYFTKTLSLPCGFILLAPSYHLKKRKYWALLIIILSLILAIIRARRGLMLISFNILAASYIINILVNKGKPIRKILTIILAPLFIFLLISVYNKNKSGTLSMITERFDEDTRTGVELFFYNDMNLEDWVFGRGINGMYYCPIGIDDNIYGLPDMRGGVETDYLTIILKGGIISLLLLLFIAIPAIIKGLFYSKNKLSKAAGIWIILYLISLYPTTVTAFTLNYLLVWISIGICYSNEIRDISEESLTSYFIDNKSNSMISN